MKKWKQRGTAVLLAAVMAVNLCALPAGASETEGQGAPAEIALTAETPETAKAPETQAPETQAPETQAPETQAPETQAPETQAPETQAPETQAPETQAQTTEAPKTEAQTTEAPASQAPDTEETSQPETGTEEETETEESGVYVWEKDGISAQVTLPERVVLPENAVLKVKAEKKDSDNRKDSIALVEKTETGLYFGEYIVYDIHFESDGKKLDLEDYTGGAKLKEDEIEVIFTFEKPVFKERNVKNETVKVYHIKDLTDEELAAARALAQSAEDPEAEIDEQKAVELKSDVKMTKDKEAVSEITFYTDGFSDYVFAVTADEPETEETQGTSENGSEEGTDETESGSPEETDETESGSLDQTNETEDGSLQQTDETQESETLQSETAEILPLADGTPDAKKRLTLAVGQLGHQEAENYVVTLQPDSQSADLSQVELETGAPAGARVEVKNSRLEVTIPVTGADKKTVVTLTGLGDGTYTVDAGGSTWINNTVGNGSRSDEYTSLYRINGENPANGAVYYNAPQSIAINSQSGTDNQTADIFNVYTKASLKLVDRESGKAVKSAGGEYVLYAGSTVVNSQLTLADGQAVLTGLPVGNITVPDGTLSSGMVINGITYSWKMKNAQSAPDGYVDLNNSSAFSFCQAEAGLEAAVDAKLETAPTKVKLLAKDTSGKEINGLTMKIKDETAGTQWKETYKSGETVTGKFVAGHKYTITQEDRPAGYVKAKGKDSYTLEISNTADLQGTKEGQCTVNKAIVVKVADVLKNNTDSHISGGTLQILAADKKTVVVSGITSQNGWYTLSKEQREKIEPGKKYYLKEVKAPRGHYTSAKQVEFEINADGEATAVLKYVTTKLVFTRYAYDFATRKDGKVSYENRKPLAGAKIELRDSQGNVVDSWTTTEMSYTCEGKVNVGEKYTLVEVETPKGYATPASYTFTTEPGAEQQGRTVSVSESGYIRPYANVALQAPRYGSVEVAKRVAFNGKAKKLSENRTFYCGIYTDKDMEKEHLYKEMAITMTPDDVFGTNTFTNVLPGIYYLAETDGNGNRITGQKEDEVFTATVGGNPLKVKGGTKADGNILNNYTKISTTLRDLSDSEQAAWNDVPKSYTGTTDEDGNTVTAENAKTNDPTKFIPYIIMVIAALAAIIGVIVYKKKKK